MRVEFFWYIVGAILAVISMIGVIYCVAHGKGAGHKILVCLASLWGVVFLICFGGNVILSIFDMGWRCKPFNIMLKLCCVLFFPMLLCGLWQLFHLEDPKPALALFGASSMFLAILITPLSVFLYFESSWSDGLTTCNDQTIVYATDSHGGSGRWRYYLPVNDLVHGAEITQDGWHGPRPCGYPSN